MSFAAPCLLLQFSPRPVCACRTGRGIRGDTSPLPRGPCAAGILCCPSGAPRTCHGPGIAPMHARAARASTRTARVAARSSGRDAPAANGPRRWTRRRRWRRALLRRLPASSPNLVVKSRHLRLHHFSHFSWIAVPAALSGAAVTALRPTRAARWTSLSPVTATPPPPACGSVPTSPPRACSRLRDGSATTRRVGAGRAAAANATGARRSFGTHSAVPAPRGRGALASCLFCAQPARAVTVDPPAARPPAARRTIRARRRRAAAVLPSANADPADRVRGPGRWALSVDVAQGQRPDAGRACYSRTDRHGRTL